MEKKKTRSTEDVLKLLCYSVKTDLSMASQTAFADSPMAQKVVKTCLKPDKSAVSSCSTAVFPVWWS